MPKFTMEDILTLARVQTIKGAEHFGEPVGAQIVKDPPAGASADSSAAGSAPLSRLIDLKQRLADAKAKGNEEDEMRLQKAFLAELRRAAKNHPSAEILKELKAALPQPKEDKK